jgi:hypothetical protein
VTLYDGQNKLELGRLVQKYSAKQTVIDIYDKDQNRILSIAGKLRDGMKFAVVNCAVVYETKCAE